jgi:hypothetical protein
MPQRIAEAITVMNLNRWIIMTGIVVAYFLVWRFGVCQKLICCGF